MQPLRVTKEPNCRDIFKLIYQEKGRKSKNFKTGSYGHWLADIFLGLTLYLLTERALIACYLLSLAMSKVLKGSHCSLGTDGLVEVILQP